MERQRRGILGMLLGAMVLHNYFPNSSMDVPRSGRRGGHRNPNHGKKTHKNPEDMTISLCAGNFGTFGKPIPMMVGICERRRIKRAMRRAA